MEEDSNQTLKTVNDTEKLVLGAESIINSRYGTNNRDYGLALKQTLSFKKDEPTHKYFFTPYNLGRIVHRMNLKENEQTYIDLNKTLTRVMKNELYLDTPATDFVPLPGPIEQDLKTMKQNSISGVMQEIEYVFITIDNKLYLYSYNITSRHQKFCLFVLEENEVIVSLGWLKQRSNPNADYYLLFVSTPFKVYIFNLVLTPEFVKINHFKPVLSCSTDGVLLTNIQTVKDGRVFLGGADGILYQLNYAIKGFNKNETIVARLFSDLLPSGNFCSLQSTSFLKSFSSFVLPAVFGQARIIKIVYDSNRERLYVIKNDSSITCYLLTNEKKEKSKNISFSSATTIPNTKQQIKKGKAFKAYKTLTKLSQKVNKYLQNPLHSVHICGVLAQDLTDIKIADFSIIKSSSITHAIIVTTLGIRIYLSENLDIFHIRGPPSTLNPLGDEIKTGIKPGAKLKDHLNVVSSSCSDIDNQVVFGVNNNSNSTNKLFLFTPELISRELYDPKNKVLNVLPIEQTFHEKFEIVDLNSIMEAESSFKILELQNLPSNDVGVPFNKNFSSESKVLLNESNSKLLVLTTKGVLLLTRLFPIKLLKSLLFVEGYANLPILKPVLIEDFFYNFGLLRASTVFLKVLISGNYPINALDKLLTNFFTFGFMNNLLPRWKPSQNIQLSNEIISKHENVDFTGCFLAYLRLVDILISNIWPLTIFEKRTNKKMKVDYYLFRLKESELSRVLQELDGLLRIAPYYENYYNQMIAASERSDPLFSQLVNNELKSFNVTVKFVDRLYQGLELTRVLTSRFSSVVLSNLEKEYLELTFKQLVCSISGALFAESIIVLLNKAGVTDFSFFSKCPQYLSSSKLETISIMNLISTIDKHSKAEQKQIKQQIRSLLDKKYKSCQLVGTVADTKTDRERRYFIRKSQISEVLELLELKYSAFMEIYKDLILFCVRVALLFVPEVDDIYTNDCFVLIVESIFTFIKKQNNLSIEAFLEDLVTIISDKRFNEFLLNYLFENDDLRHILSSLKAKDVVSWYKKNEPKGDNLKELIHKKIVLAENLLHDNQSLQASYLFRELALIEIHEDKKQSIMGKKPFKMDFGERVKLMQKAIIAFKAALSMDYQDEMHTKQEKLLQFESEVNLLFIQSTILTKIRNLNVSEAKKLVEELESRVFPLSDLYNSCIYKFELFQEGIALMAMSNQKDEDELKYLYKAIIAKYSKEGKANDDLLIVIKDCLERYYVKGYFPTAYIVTELETLETNKKGMYKVMDIFIQASIIPFNLFDVYLKLGEEAKNVERLLSMLQKVLYGLRSAKEKGLFVATNGQFSQLVAVSSEEKSGEVIVPGVGGISEEEVRRIVQTINSLIGQIDPANWEVANLSLEKQGLEVWMKELML